MNNERVYENEECACDTCRFFVNNECGLEDEGCQTSLFECLQTKNE